MNKKLFIGGLSWNTSEARLRETFEKFGDLDDIRIITDRDTGRSRGFGFVTFAEEDSAQKAIAEMDGCNLDGRNIKVNEAEEKPRRSAHRPPPPHQ
ncbi:MAG: RNA-binding protein [Pseudomonadota bacterium]|nr:RNA-binding protein [Pseudomonadota bacterium]